MPEKPIPQSAPAAPASLMNINETAADWRVSRTTVWRKIRAGALPVVRLGGRTLIRRSDADAFIDRCARGEIR